MKITSCQVFPILENEGKKLKAFARITLNDALVLTSLRVYQGTNGLFVSYPSDPNYKGEDYKQLYYPVTAELRKDIEETILKDYEKEKPNED